MLGGAVGSFISGYLVGLLGERQVQFIVTFPSTLSWLFIIFAKSTVTLYVGRFFCGFCWGIIMPASAIYIAELSSPDKRGRFLALTALEQPMGTFLCYGLGTLVNWRMVAVAGSCIPTLQMIWIAFCPESPVWLIQHSKEEEAKKSLTWFRGTSRDIDKEFALISENVEKTRNLPVFRLIFSKEYLLPVTIVVAAYFFMQFCGFPALISYTLLIFRRADITFISDSVAVNIVGVNLVALGIVALLLIDNLGRRPLMLTSTAIAATSQIGMACYFYLLWTHAVTSELNYLPFIFFQVFVLGFQIGINNVGMVLLGELFPSYIRAHAAGMVNGLSLCFIVAVTELFLPLSEASHYFGGFLFFGINCLVDFVFMYFLLPETKGLRLEEVENGFCLNTVENSQKEDHHPL